MFHRSSVLIAGVALAALVQTVTPGSTQPVLRRHHYHHPAVVDPNSPPPPDYGFEAAPGSYPARGYGQDPRPNGGFAVNPYGFGNYTQGADGGFGGYPPGSVGAHELQEQQTRKCRVVPEQC